MEVSSSLATALGMSASNWFFIVRLREYLMLLFSGEKEKRGLQLRTMKVCYWG